MLVHAKSNCATICHKLQFVLLLEVYDSAIFQACFLRTTYSIFYWKGNFRCNRAKLWQIYFVGPLKSHRLYMAHLCFTHRCLWRSFAEQHFHPQCTNSNYWTIPYLSGVTWSTIGTRHPGGGDGRAGRRPVCHASSQRDWEYLLCLV